MFFSWRLYLGDASILLLLLKLYFVLYEILNIFEIFWGHLLFIALDTYYDTMLSNHWLVDANIEVVVEWPFLKPDWYFEIILFSTR